METPEETRAVSILSKKRYFEILSRLANQYTPQQIESIALAIRDVMHFDPTKSTYTKEKGLKTVESRKLKSITTGISQYKLSGNDKIYAKKKMARELAATT